MQVPNIILQMQIASITGAWIETYLSNLNFRIHVIASITGAWIETGWDLDALRVEIIASITGAWIETEPRQEVQTLPNRVHHGRVD